MRRRGLSQATVNKYRSVVTKFIDLVAHDEIRRVAKLDVLRFKDFCFDVEGRSYKTVKDGDLPALKAVFGWAHENCRIDTDPSKGVVLKRIKSTEQTKAKGYSDEGARRLVRTALAYKRMRHDRSDKEVALRRFAPLLCALTGARIGEIVQQGFIEYGVGNRLARADGTVCNKTTYPQEMPSIASRCGT